MFDGEQDKIDAAENLDSPSSAADFDPFAYHEPAPSDSVSPLWQDVASRETPPYHGAAGCETASAQGASGNLPYGSIDRTMVYAVPVVRARRAARAEEDAARNASRVNCRHDYSAFQDASSVARREDEDPSRRVGCAERRGASTARWIARILLLGVLVFGVMTVYYLTEQTVDQTSSLSGAAQGYAEYGAYLVQSGQSPSVKADPVKWAAERILLVSYKLSAHGLDIRHQAHVVEFGLIGGIIAMNVLAWLSGWAHRRDAAGRLHGWRTFFMFVLAISVCAAASFADQYHKLSVPGRHFDRLDLVLDASGYFTAVIVVFLLWSIGSSVYRAIAGK